VIKINGALQHFAWGDTKAIAEIRGLEPSGRPEAEYWFGTHPKGPSQVVLCPNPPPGDDADRNEELAAIIAQDRQGSLGPITSGRFGELPFLLKLLAAARPLSIQAHPNQVQAVEGFDREERLGIARDASNRNYRDRNHKPELICAITRFEAKCGFRDLADTRRLMALFSDPRVEPLQNLLKVEHANVNESAESTSVLADSVRWLLTSEPTEAADLVQGLVDEAKRLLADLETDSTTPTAGYEAELRWTLEIGAGFPGDPGVAVALLLNHVVLEPGEALFLEAGVLHSYLRGLAVELMANSDNVLRGGLSVKHVDVDQLLTVARYESYSPAVQTPGGSSHHYAVPVDEFSLVRYAHEPSDQRSECELAGPEIVLATGGDVELTSSQDPMTLASGEAAFVPYSQRRYSLRPLDPGAVAWRVGVGEIQRRP
jgi:mannose-6-phosphate isomerase